MNIIKKFPLRPTTGLMQKSIFDTLKNKYDFSKVDVLDLFCGTGNLGLKALSLEAKSTTFVDIVRERIINIQKICKDSNYKGRSFFFVEM